MTIRFFIESDFNSTHLARQVRDELAQHLIAQGLNCHSLALLRATDGIRIFAVESIDPEQPPETMLMKSRRLRTLIRRDSPPGTLRERSTTTARVAVC